MAVMNDICHRAWSRGVHPFGRVSMTVDATGETVPGPGLVHGPNAQADLPRRGNERGERERYVL
jgi:hypothetical protein